MKEAILPETIQRIGEVMEASTTEFATQCYQLYQAPQLGSLVRSGDDSPIYGIVHEVSTESMDPGRHPIARGRDEDTEEGVYLSNPQLNRLLYTGFRSMVVGHQADGQTFRYLAPLPPRIHSFVYECASEELQGFSSSLEFLSIVLSAPISATDDVTASFLRQASASHSAPAQFLVFAGKELAVLLSGQLQRLNSILRRLSP